MDCSTPRLPMQSGIDRGKQTSPWPLQLAPRQGPAPRGASCLALRCLHVDPAQAYTVKNYSIPDQHCCDCVGVEGSASTTPQLMSSFIVLQECQQPARLKPNEPPTNMQLFDSCSNLALPGSYHHCCHHCMRQVLPHTRQKMSRHMSLTWAMPTLLMTSVNTSNSRESMTTPISGTTRRIS